MAGKLEAYLHGLRHELRQALCIQCFPSQAVERHNKPHVEVAESPELVLPPVCVRRSDSECCLIEPSINSVRLSFQLRASDQLEQTLIAYYTTFLQRRAEQLDILRRAPVAGYDISFLVTDQHYLGLHVDQLVNFFCEFVEEMDRERNQLKLAVNTRSRAVGHEMLQLLAT